MDNLKFFVVELVQIPAVQAALNDALGFGTVDWEGADGAPH